MHHASGVHVVPESDDDQADKHYDFHVRVNDKDIHSGGHGSDEDTPTVSNKVNLTQFSVYKVMAAIIHF